MGFIKVDTTYFRDVNTEEKAYWLGFIAADGCIVGDKGRFRTVVNLSLTDESHLHKLKSSVEYEGNLTYGKCMLGGKTFHSVQLRIGSHEFADYLVYQGITPRKSLTITPWTGPDTLMRHYWRGYFDGNGTLVESSDGEWTLSITSGSKPMVVGLKEFMDINGVKGGSIRTKGDRVHVLTYSGKHSPQSAILVIYGDAKIYLERKRLSAEVLMAIPNLKSKWTTIDLRPADVMSLYTSLGKMTAVAKALGLKYRSLVKYCHRNGILWHPVYGWALSGTERSRRRRGYGCWTSVSPACVETTP